MSAAANLRARNYTIHEVDDHKVTLAWLTRRVAAPSRFEDQLRYKANSFFPEDNYLGIYDVFR